MTTRKINEFFKKLEPKSSTNSRKQFTEEEILKSFNVLQSKVILTDFMKKSRKNYEDNIKHEPNASFTIKLPPLSRKSVKIKDKNLQEPPAKHIKTKSGEIFKHKQSSDFDLRQRHNMSLFTCDLCGKGYTTKKKIKLHMKGFHLPAKNEFICDFDNKTFKVRQLLIAHMNQHKMKIECKICGSKMKPVALHVHMKFVHNKEREFSCEICNKNFKAKTTFLHHQKIHNKKFKCEFCGHKFSENWFLNQHIEANHKNPGKFQCEICKKKFNLEVIFKKHLSVHDKNAPKPYKCSRCNYSCQRKTNLKIHQKGHENKDAKAAKLKTPHKCQLCTTILKNKRALVTHIKFVHKKRSEFYCCDLCGKVIKFKNNILIHFKGVHKIGFA